MWREIKQSLRLEWLKLRHRDRRRIRTVIRHLRDIRKAAIAQPTAQEQALMDQIRGVTADYNRNNLTRTRAYLHFYYAHPEIHWSLLAHVVSRNGGWSMTDLHGEWFPRIAQKSDEDRFFAFLERANWLIFSDAYPQLLLYAEQKKRGTRMEHLLPGLGVSRFMQGIWTDYGETRDTRLLTCGLIVNEQNFIESRVVQNPDYSRDVLDSLQYQVQSVLNLNQALIPFLRGSEVRLSGTVVQQFGSLDERILTGNRLYALLFADRLQHERVFSWLRTVEHSGSRADYWPDVFTPRRERPGDKSYTPIFGTDTTANGRLYSPRLQDVWPDVQHAPADAGDWFQDESCLVHLFEDVTVEQLDFTDAYVGSIRTVEKILEAQDKVSGLISGKAH